jgi:hypothetical protein
MKFWEIIVNYFLEIIVTQLVSVLKLAIVLMLLLNRIVGKMNEFIVHIVQGKVLA